MTLDPHPMLTQKRFSTRLRALLGRVWSLDMFLSRQIIYWQDRLQVYSYSHWIKTVERDNLQQTLNQPIRLQINAPSVCFLIVDEISSPQAVIPVLQSLQKQTASNWILAFLLPSNAPLLEETWLKDLLTVEKRIQVIHFEGTVGSYDWLKAVPSCTAEWIVPLRTGDQISPAWMNLFTGALSARTNADIVYWDEDVLDAQGKRSQPFFKPDWSPELLFSLNYLESAAFQKDLLAQAGDAGGAGWIFQSTQSARQIVHIPQVLQHHASCFLKNNEIRAAVHAAQVRAFLSQQSFEEVETQIIVGSRVHVNWKSKQPLVSIIIPTKNNLPYLQRCLNTLLERTNYLNFEVLLMDDHSSDPAVLSYYRDLCAANPNIYIYENEAGTFNYSQVNNRGAHLAKGELLLFLNNDMEILSGGWLAEMVRWALMPGVGMVGAKLLYPDRKIQHAGVVIGMTGHAGHLFAGDVPVESKLFVSPDAYRNVSAVTGACMLVRRAVFEEIGGFDENLSLVFNDVEIGLRVLRSGHRIVYTPAAALIHYEGRSRGRFIPPRNISLGAELLWSSIENGDPYYNPNLSYAVNWPTLHRRSEPIPIKRLKEIVRFKGV